MDSIIVVGSGPVGSFTAVLCAQLGFDVTVYEKRTEFTRNINLKLECNFFNEVQEVLSRLNVKSDIFSKLNESLRNRRNRILIKELEGTFAKEAKILGARFVTREINSLGELHEEHKKTKPLILDCSGRNSKLRISEFGSDQFNIVTVPLQHAMYINFKARMKDDISLYQVMKYVKTIKLSEVVVSKLKDIDGFSNITLPVFITRDLASVFDKEYPNINRNPLNPFNSLDYVPDKIMFRISSLIANLIVDGCNIDLNSVEVKKIEITCGYAKLRSRDNYVCLGDSAIHLAFFRSLNLGLRHALELFIKLSIYHNESGVRPLKEGEIINKFISHSPHLMPIKVYPTVAMNIFLVVTKVIWYGCFSFCVTTNKTERLTDFLGVNESQIGDVLFELNKKLSIWKNTLADFEAERYADIKYEIESNKTKNLVYDSLSFFIDINGKSFIKLSEFTRAISGKHLLFKNDFKFFLRCFKARKDALVTSTVFTNIVKYLMNHSDDRRFEPLRRLCASQALDDDSKRRQICITVHRQIHKRKKQSSKLETVPKLLTGILLGDMDVKSRFILALIENEMFHRFLRRTDPLAAGTNSTLDRPNFKPVAGTSLM